MVGERSVSYMMLSLQRTVLCHLLLHSVQSAIVNVALHKPSWQSSTDYQWYASRANNGNTSNVQAMVQNSCSHTNGTGQYTAWWQVDLGQSYDISHILLTTRNWINGPSRLAGFSIYVSGMNKSSWTHSELCFYDSPPQSQVANGRRIDCTNSMNGRYIVVFNKRPVSNATQGFNYSPLAILELCEVNVPVEIDLGNCVDSGCTNCQVGWFGERCEHSCANCGGSQGCNKETGICSMQFCKNGYYGSTCALKCPTNCLNGVCNFIYGTCSNCKDNYFGTYCRQRCPNNCILCTSIIACSSCNSGWYGTSCSSNCSNCGGNGSCHKNDGQCVSQSCRTGFYGSLCSLACSFNCIGYECEFWTGMCTNCPNGMYGVHCETDCPYSCSTCKDNTNCYTCKKGFYGRVCNQTCTGCGGNGFCRQLDGVCNSSSCQPKYYGLSGKCDQNCPPNCGGDGSCNFHRGNCSDGCMSGYMGERCNQLCSQNCAGDKSCENDGECLHGCNNGWFGLQCTTTCPDNCGDGTCDRTNGACGGECAKTYYGSDCSKSCPENCGGDGTCDRNGGTCSDRCKPGWNGTNCDSECPFPKFGADCTEDCGYCRNNSCNHINGTCIQGCEDGWTSTQCDIRASKSVDDNSNEANTGVIGGAVAAVVVLVVVAVVVIVLRRRSQGISKGRGLSDSNAYMNSPVQEQVSTQNAIYTNVMSVEEEKRASKPKILIPKPVLTQYEPPHNAYESERTYYNSVDFKMGVEVNEFKAYVTEKLSSNKYEEEFKGIPYGAISPTAEAELPKNMKKNRFKTTFPYDHSRVVLKGKTDYINANFIEDTDGIKKYIATQGPIPNTIEDFWQMVWEYNIDIIVMLTNLQEGKKKKCEQYWPNPNEKMTQGQFGLSLLDERQFSYYVLRELDVHDSKSKQKRKIQQYHFTTWPDHGTPDPLFLVLFHKRVISTAPKYDGPILVHCSAGIGRTGTFIALDALENQGKKYGKVDIENYVRIMRKDRMNMIQTSEQYKVLHEALIEAFQWKDTFISMGDFPSVWQKIESDKGPLNQQNLKKEYDMLREMKSDQENPVSALKDENKVKSRTDSILPLDKHRPYLSSYFPGGNDFINSVMIPSHISKDAFLVTQVPLPGTVVDFWRMIVDHDSRSIVYFASPSDDGTNFYPSHEDTVETEMHIITKESSNILQERVEEIKIQVKNKKSSQTKDVVMLKIDIADNNYPSGAQIFRAAEVVELQRSRNKNCPCTVVALDGCTPCEVFCAISNILEYMKVDNRIDVFQTARQLQSRRPEFFGTFETYRYCYQIINEYLITQSVYFNM